MNYSARPSSRPNWWNVYGASIAVGMLSLSGLASALLFGEVGSLFAWIGVGSPIIVVLYVLVTRFRRTL